MISICSLIYRSTRYADAVWESAHEFTPALHDGRARFFFVANDATEQVIEHLEARGYPHVVQKNDRLTDGELKDLDFDPPEYIRRVYQGWNRAILESEERMVLVNSDNLFSPGWFDALIGKVSGRHIVCSKIVERQQHPRHPVFECAIRGSFGDHPDRFDKDGFLRFCAGIRGGVESGGAYMPCALLRSEAIRAGLYPQGNPRGTFGDQDFFRRLQLNGVEHITALDSLVYHFKEGEMDE